MPSNLYLYDKYYDIIYQDKDYKKETSLVLNLSRKLGIQHPQRVLEIGCGTGNQTRLLSKLDMDVVAIDIDLAMVRIARKKLSGCQNVKIIHTPIERLEEKKFDLAIAMFNIVTYIDSISQLVKFMEGVAQRLNRNGLFIFDCWNGIAVIKDPPRRLKKAVIKQGNLLLKCNLTSKTDFFNQKTELNYEIKVNKGKKIVNWGNSWFYQTLWTPIQIKHAISEAGLRLLLCSPLMQPDKKATEKDWKIMFCCKKSG